VIKSLRDFITGSHAATGRRDFITMNTIRIRKGYRLNIAGAPSEELKALEPPATLAALPERVPFVKPKLSVAEGDSVNVGSLLYVDKRNPDLKFCSPAGGVVKDIQYGPRRVIEQIVIERDEVEVFETFPSVDQDALSHIDRAELVALLQDGGLWPLIRELPVRDIAGPDREPPAVIVSLDRQEPFHPSARVYLEGRLDLLRYGLAVMHRLAGEAPVIVGAYPQTADRFSGFVTHRVAGAYPADDPGSLLYRIKTSPAQNNAWFVSGQDLLLIAHLLGTGTYPTERTVVVAGSAAQDRRHFRTRLGAPLAHLAGGDWTGGSPRFIVGGVFTGYSGSPGSHLGLYETSVTVVPKGEASEFLSLFRPGWAKPTYSRLFLSRFNPGPLVHDCNRRGGRRACIACMHCADVCPVDILPQMTYKAILAEEVEEALGHGLLDCVECGLCSYVCPAKIELTEALRHAKAAYAREKGA